VSGRTTTGKPKVVDVESLPCSAGGTHVLRNAATRGGLVTACLGCGRSWSEIDAEARGGAA
jgi:hypothetical protein